MFKALGNIFGAAPQPAAPTINQSGTAGYTQLVFTPDQAAQMYGPPVQPTKRARDHGEVTVQMLQSNSLFKADKETLKTLWLARFGGAWVAALPGAPEEDLFFIRAANCAGLEVYSDMFLDETTGQYVRAYRLQPEDGTNS